MSSIGIVSVGALSAVGSDANSTFKAVCAGADGLTPFTRFPTGLKIIPSLAVINYALQEQQTLPPNRTTHLAACAISQALQCLPKNHNLRIGLVFATTVGGITESERAYASLCDNSLTVKDAAKGFAFHEATSSSGWLAKEFGLCGFHTISTACSSGLHAIGICKRLLENNHYDLCIAAGADAHCMLTIRGFAGLLLIDPNGCRPFNADRAGTSLGEGAGAMLLASDKALQKLNCTPMAFVSGYGSSADCHHMTAPHPTGDGAKRSVENALVDAGIGADAINAIAAHGTGTPDNDFAEITGMKSVFEKLPPFFSFKRTIGHTLGASGTLEAVLSVKCLVNQIIPPTAGFTITDEKIGAAPGVFGTAHINHLLKNSFGFGGNNASVIFSRYGAKNS